MSRTLFISDLHLDAARPAVTAALSAFLERSRDAEALYILGDLFEAWIGDDDDAPLGHEVAARLRHYALGGAAVFLMHGNRDFLLGERFAEAALATLLPDPTTIDLYGEPTLLMHGDILCTRDVDYQQFRTLTRAARWQADWLAHPLEERRRLAAGLREMSADATGRKAEDIMDVSPDAVDQAMADAGVRRLIHGHTHRPHRHRESHGERVVLGDWDRRGWCLEASAKGLELSNFII